MDFYDFMLLLLLYLLVGGYGKKYYLGDEVFYDDGILGYYFMVLCFGCVKVICNFGFDFVYFLFEGVWLMCE